MCHDYVDRGGTYEEVGGPGFDLHIRICEECHSPASLHNIQADSNGGGVVVGGELEGYGHVGRDSGFGDENNNGLVDSDCWGCHGFEFASSTPISTAIIPTVYNSDRASITAGKDTTVILSGAAFTNTSGGKLYESDVRLTAADGSTVTLEPEIILDQGNMAVKIPAKTKPGNYRLQATKDKVASNPVNLSVTPAVSISRATYQGTVTILGSGFAGYAKGSSTSVTATVTTVSGRRTTSRTVEGKIVSWTDTKIVADFGMLPQNVTVNSVFGTAKATVSRR